MHLLLSCPEGECAGEHGPATKPALLRAPPDSLPAVVSLLFSSLSSASTWVLDQSGAPEEIWGQHIFPKDVCPWGGDSATVRHF